jgi:hypothetical protein
MPEPLNTTEQKKLLAELTELLKTVRHDPMLWMYFIKMADTFGDRTWWSESRNRTSVRQSAENLSDWLSKNLYFIDDLNLKANYEFSSAYVLWILFEHGLNEKDLRKAKDHLDSSIYYAQSYEARFGRDAFIYSEFEERLVHASVFCREAQTMKKTVETLESLTNTLNRLEQAVKIIEQAGKAISDSSQGLDMVVAELKKTLTKEDDTTPTPS